MLRKQLIYFSGASGSFSPAALNPYAWWAASRSDLIAQSGGLVSSWRDVVGGYNLAQGTGSFQPVYSATGFNGQPVVSADGLDDTLELTGVPVGIPTGATPCEEWVRVDQTALVADTTARTAGSVGGGTTVVRSTSRIVTGGANRARLTVGTGAVGVTSDNLSVDLAGRHVIRAISTGTNIITEVDGVSNAPVACVPGVATTRVRMFANAATAASSFWQGGVTDRIITAPLTAGQAAQLYAYLNRGI